jgi:DHA1 family multidrug resistance protein-like MFS transporter
MNRKAENWRRNLYILWFGTFMSGAANSMIIPFIPLFINEIGDFTTAQVSFWSGIIFSATFLAMAIVSPFWGKMADLKGRKLMLLRSSLCMSIVIFLMGFAANVYQLLLLRILLGLLSGFKSNAIALMATSAPKEHGGQVLGTLATGSVAGGLIGPIMGGFIAEFFGYRATFFCTGTIIFLVFILTLSMVKENFTPIQTSNINIGIKALFGQLQNPRIIIGMLLTTMIIQITNNSINPILSLYVKQILQGDSNVSIISGIIAALPGIATLIAAPLFGKIGDHFGTRKILMGGLLLSILIYIPMAYVHDIRQLGLLRLLIGVSDAALLPSIQAILMKNSPQSATGRVFSYNQTAQSTGNVVGPMVGSTVSGHIGFHAVFFATSFFALTNYLVVRFFAKERS